jgi:hypothetical protein
MNTKALMVTILFFGAIIIFEEQSISPNGKIDKPKPQPQPIIPIEPEPAPPPVPPKIEPEFKNHPPLRKITKLGKVLSDIESHMPAGHIYRDSDRITWGHETTHGINSRLRMEYSRLRGGSEGYHGTWVGNRFKSFAGINGFYVLEDQAVIIKEPNTTIQASARLVPRSLRGGVYNLYMIQQARSWGDTPLYIFDEWVSYANGSAVRLDLGISRRAETVKFMLEFNVYAICVAQASKSEDPQFKKFLMWHLERSMKLYKDSVNLGDLSKSTAYLELTKTSSDASEFRAFCRDYFGAEWTKKILEF